MIRLDFSIELGYQVLSTSEFELIIHASRTGRQKIVRESFEVTPPAAGDGQTVEFLHNRHMQLHVEPGPLTIRYCAMVDLDHWLTPSEQLREVPVAEMPVEVRHYLRPSRYCPSDSFFELAMDEFGRIPSGYERVRTICEWVRNRTRFQVGTTNAFHSAIDTLRDRVGVCRDFAHLMISLCRALNIPARYSTSIDYGADPALGPMDFHAYVEVFLCDRWYTFDPTGIANPMGLVRIATGRDANDVAFATIFGSVLHSVPKISMVAIEDASAGISAPVMTDMAISTSEAEEEFAQPELSVA